jgi:hypothetical protein
VTEYVHRAVAWAYRRQVTFFLVAAGVLALLTWWGL